MRVIKPQRKPKNIEMLKNMKNWMLIEHEGNEKISKGIYKICPCCFSPFKLDKEHLEYLAKDIERMENKANNKLKNK